MGNHDCGTLVPVFVEGSGVASHVGRYEYSSRECVDFGSASLPYTGRFTITAANGDAIVGIYAGNAAVAGTTIFYEQTHTITGGTGRFAGASGEFETNGIAYEDGSHEQVLSGAISSVGSEK